MKRLLLVVIGSGIPTLAVLGLAGCGPGPSDASGVQSPSASPSGDRTSAVDVSILGSGGPAPGTVVPLPGTVTITSSPGGQLVATFHIDAGGSYRIRLAPGRYLLTADCGGQSPLTVADGVARHVQLICAMA